ncbi:hypothetical protein [Methylobacterium sp. R2-1]|uniref:hypothetical protein n=1 Tax=Methylobacterium sp. R2-1 TaxID=2587064 RepID=UPI00160E5E29|nr:hypothetical protein [Methylobacterium sp. R2-1]MBB2965224.1 hypothetical protein [Methylobacterium sp. R2-1]
MASLVQIRDDQGRKITCLTVGDGERPPPVPDGWTIEAADATPLWQAQAEVISDRQFAQALALDGIITQAEALAWAARGDLPEAMSDALAEIPETGGQRFGAHMLLAGATTFERSHPLTEVLGALLTNPETGQPYDAAALDALWARASAL